MRRGPFQILTTFLTLLFMAPIAQAQNTSLLLTRDQRVLSLVPYAPNIVRVTIGKEATPVAAAPGYGISGSPAATGWTHQHATEAETYASPAMSVRISPETLREAQRPQRMPLDAENNRLRDLYFGNHGGPAGTPNDSLEILTPQGKSLLTMSRWSMSPEAPEVARYDEVLKGSRVSATFSAHPDEHFYGLGQQQQGWMDLRDHQIQCWQDYNHIGGQNVCVPFLISTRGYALLWDNPSKTTIDLGFNDQTVWTSEVGDRVSFFIITGTTDQLYQGYRQLTGITHLLPRATYGFIQSKAIYPTQQQVLDVAQEYRAKHLPLDAIVIDFLNMTRQGELDLDPARWPDPAAMNRTLHSMGIDTVLSVWPHFSVGTQFYDMLLSKGWLIHDRQGVPDPGGYKSNIGPNIDTTNPQAALWWWEKIRDRFIKPFGFDFVWLDETEPDIDPARDLFAIGSGTRFYNVYPLFHTASVYDGFRRDFGDTRRVMILARAAFTGAQRNGTVFWSSDIVSTWDMLKRSIPAGLNFTASGLPYWDTDIAGFFSPVLPFGYHAEHPPLISGADAAANIGRYEDYPELYVRWFQYGVFQPILRTHGERDHNEVWAYGAQAESILAKYLRLRYQLLPYTYSAAFQSYKSGAPYMRALFMDFPGDPQALNIPDEYMYGPAFLVAPVTEQGATHRSVYLPAGTDWFNFWTNQRLHGGQTIEAEAPIDTLPLFVRAGSIVPMGAEIQSAHDNQAIAEVRIYPGTSTTFTLYQDDGRTYDYEKSGGRQTTLTWNQATQKLTQKGPKAFNPTAVKVIP